MEEKGKQKEQKAAEKAHKTGKDTHTSSTEGENRDKVKCTAAIEESLCH